MNTFLLLRWKFLRELVWTMVSDWYSTWIIMKLLLMHLLDFISYYLIFDFAHCYLIRLTQEIPHHLSCFRNTQDFIFWLSIHYWWKLYSIFVNYWAFVVSKTTSYLLLVFRVQYSAGLHYGRNLCNYLNFIP